ncbi:MAG TPA: MarR family transcriptional regulator [Pirellulales bacterium]|jgi:DNA-binding MarR family transcriptional regulator|nr:MarR family transcriptional regulator [Pirellulales bacterium]
MSRRTRNELIETLLAALRNGGTHSMLFHALVAERLGLYATDHKCLDFLLREGPITAGRLSELTGLTTGAITGIVDRLEQAGFVARQRDEQDRRKVIVQPDIRRIESEIGPLFASLARAARGLFSSYSDNELAVIHDFVMRSQRMMQEESAKLRAIPVRKRQAAGGR